MASKLSVLLLLALIAYALTAPVPTDQVKTTTVATDDGITLLEVIKVVDEVPVVVAFIDSETTTAAAEETKDSDHKVVKRSVLRGDNPSNDLLADLEGLNYENGLSSLDGRRIKFLPTWLG